MFCTIYSELRHLARNAFMVLLLLSSHESCLKIDFSIICQNLNGKLMSPLFIIIMYLCNDDLIIMVAYCAQVNLRFVVRYPTQNV